MVRDLLIEIGTEEIPAGYLKTAISSFAEGLNALFESKRISHSPTKTFYTPRRLTVIVKDVAEEQEKIVKKIKGPNVNLAYKDGKPTKAAEGFASGKGVPVESLKIEKINGKEYVVAEVEEEVKTIKEIIQDSFPSIIKEIEFPKKMRWESTNFLFARPIRWIVALLDNEKIDFSISGVKSSDLSRGHFLISPKKIKVNPKNYLEKLRDSYVMVDPDEREKKLKDMIIDAADRINAEPILPPGLLEEVSNLIEYPFVILGSFDEKFLSLPDKVIITAMETHQRYFPLKKEEKLIPFFISGINNFPNDEVIKSNEKVLEARLEDAKFYWEVDKKIPLSKRVSKLSGIMWHKNLGTLLDRTERLIRLSEWIGKRVGEVDLKVIREGAKLSKADLTTLMIRDGKEFTNLEGYIGSEYGRLEGLPEKICKVIEEHYKPRHSEDELPKSIEAAVVSLADRIDLTVGGFLSGERPTGSRDPLGLRQAFNGFIRILQGFNFDFSLSELIKVAINQFQIETDEKVYQEIKKFVKDRIEGYLQTKSIRYDIANAVLSEKWDNILNATLISEAMTELRKDETEFKRLVIGQKRVSNILKGEEVGKFNESSLKEKEERELYNKAKEIEPILKESVQKKEYLKALNLLKSLRLFIDNLFDNVLVMTEDEELRNNRLALLYYVRSLFHQLCDFEEIVID